MRKPQPKNPQCTEYVLSVLSNPDLNLSVVQLSARTSRFTTQQITGALHNLVVSGRLEKSKLEGDRVYKYRLTTEKSGCPIVGKVRMGYPFTALAS